MRGIIGPIESQQQFLSDCLDDARRVLEDIVVPEANYTIAERLNCLGAARIDRLAMMATIHLHHQMSGPANEVCHVRSDGELP